jgi:hypothetical protein
LHGTGGWVAAYDDMAFSKVASHNRMIYLKFNRSPYAVILRGGG